MNLVKQRRAVIVYLRDKKKNPKGVAVVYKANNGELKVGWSKCHSMDTFDRQAGLYTALRRALPVSQVLGDLEELPTGIGRVVTDAIDKAGRYFGGTQVKAKPKAKRASRAKRSVEPEAVA